MKLIERKFYKYKNNSLVPGKVEEVNGLEDCDYMIVKEQLTRKEAEEKYPLIIYPND